MPSAAGRAATQGGTASERSFEESEIGVVGERNAGRSR